MNQRESVCITDGCLWLNGGVCSRECEYKKELSGNTTLYVDPPIDLSLIHIANVKLVTGTCEAVCRSSGSAVKRPIMQITFILHRPFCISAHTSLPAPYIPPYPGRFPLSEARP